jgi:hypothetical protein
VQTIGAEEPQQNLTKELADSTEKIGIEDLAPPRSQGIATQRGRTSGVYIVHRHPLKDGWTYSRKGAYMPPSKWRRRKVRKSWLDVMLYLRSYSVPWQMIVWQFGP